VPLCSGRCWRLLGLRALLERGGGQEASLCKGELVGEEGDDIVGAVVRGLQLEAG